MVINNVLLALLSALSSPAIIYTKEHKIIYSYTYQRIHTPARIYTYVYTLSYIKKSAIPCDRGSNKWQLVVRGCDVPRKWDSWCYPYLWTFLVRRRSTWQVLRKQKIKGINPGESRFAIISPSDLNRNKQTRTNTSQPRKKNIYTRTCERLLFDTWIKLFFEIAKKCEKRA